MSDVPPVRYSNLRHMARSPAHYKYAIEHPSVGVTTAMRIGTLVHQIVLGGPDPVVYDGVRRGNTWAEFKADHAGQEIFTAAETDLAIAIAPAVLENETAAGLLQFNRERQIEWTMAGRSCQGRIDSFSDEAVADLKVTFDANPERFVRHATRMGYPAQLAWYKNGLELAGIAKPRDCYFVAVESKPPHVVTVLKMTERALDLGRRTYWTWWEQLMNCERSNTWPGYVSGVVDFDSPEDLDLIIDGETVEVEGD